jgi:anti-sigma regulatory factor (Ser/Thr protein kinase)
MATPMIPTKEIIEITVVEALDCASVQLTARQLASTIGFAPDVCEEVALAAVELASNIVKHAGRGILTFCPLDRGGLKGIEVDAADQGPGIQDIERSFTDGFSTKGSLGYGLGTVNRLMDEVDVRSMPGSGTHVVCRRWVRGVERESTMRMWDVGVATRSRHYAPQNGDAFIVRERNGELLVALIDGLGHGEPAETAAMAAQQYVRSHIDMPLADLFQGVSRACRGTRGVVMALARFSAGRISFASVGNVEARVLGGAERSPFVVNRGIVGANDVHVTAHDYLWDPKWILILHTDGLLTRWQWEDFPGLPLDPAQVIARRLLHDLAFGDDDATALVVKSVPR